MTEQNRTSVLTPALTLTAAVAAGWAVCFWPARSMNAESGVFWMSIAAICCLVPGWIVVFLSGLAIFPTDLSAMLGQTMVRLFSVAGVAIVTKKLKPEVGFEDFYGWLVGFYLLTMAVEVWMLRQSLNKSSQCPDDQPIGGSNKNRDE